MANRYDETLMLGYLENDLTSKQRAQFEKQIESNDRMRQLVTQLRRDREQLRQTSQEPAPGELMEQVIQRLEREILFGGPATGVVEQTQPKRSSVIRVLTWSAAAAMVLIGGSIAFLVFTEKNPLWPSGKHDLYATKAPADAAEPDLLGPALTTSSKFNARTDGEPIVADKTAAPSVASLTEETSELEDFGPLPDESGPMTNLVERIATTLPGADETKLQYPDISDKTSTAALALTDMPAGQTSSTLQQRMNQFRAVVRKESAETTTVPRPEAELPPISVRDVQIDIITDDRTASVAILHELAEPNQIRHDAEDRTISNADKYIPLGTEIRMSGEQLNALVGQLRTKKNQTVRLHGLEHASYRVAEIKKRDNEALVALMQLDWAAILREQLPMSPITPIVQSDAPFMVRVRILDKSNPPIEPNESSSDQP